MVLDTSGLFDSFGQHQENNFLSTNSNFIKMQKKYRSVSVRGKDYESTETVYGHIINALNPEVNFTKISDSEYYKIFFQNINGSCHCLAYMLPFYLK
jgi:hypothetical protein